MAQMKKTAVKKVAAKTKPTAKAKLTVKASPKPTMTATKKRPDVSWINPDAGKYGDKLTNRDMFLRAVQTISETTESRRDVGQGPALIAAVGAKYKQNPTAAIAAFKKSFIAAGVPVPDSWLTPKPSTTKKPK
jgi:sarcosine oxidase gamma subunit